MVLAAKQEDSQETGNQVPQMVIGRVTATTLVAKIKSLKKRHFSDGTACNLDTHSSVYNYKCKTMTPVPLSQTVTATVIVNINKNKDLQPHFEFKDGLKDGKEDDNQDQAEDGAK